MNNVKDMFVNGFNIVYCADKDERYSFYQKFVAENPEYAYDNVHYEFWDRRKRSLFCRVPSAMGILKNNKAIKKRNSPEKIVKLIKELELDYCADRIPRALKYQERVMFSIAWDMLETGKEKFTIYENGGYYTKEAMAFVASRVYDYIWNNDMQMIWITDSVPDDEAVLKCCDNLLELKGGELIKHSVKDASKEVKKESESEGSLFKRVEKALKSEPAPVVKEPVKTTVAGSSTPKLISKDRMPAVGKVCRLPDGTEGVVLSHHYGPIKKIECYDFSIRELKNGNVSQLRVMWNRESASPQYSSFYKSTYPRQGAEAEKLGDFICWYEQKSTNAEYASYEADLRFCTYLGNNLCKDIFTGEVYRPEIYEPIPKELENVKVGGVVSVCLYCGKIYFGGSYRIERFVALYAPDKSGTLRYYDAAHYGLLYTGKVYMEKNGKLTSADPKKGEQYVLTRVTALDGTNNSLYIGMSDAFAWISPAKGEIKYGLLKGNYDEKWKSKSVTFTPFNEEKTYKVNKELFSDTFFEVLCERDIPAKAEVFDVDCHLAIPDSQPLERRTLEYTYQDDGVACCIDMDNADMVNIPCKDIPGDITEGCVFYYYPEIKYCVLLGTPEPKDEEPVGESVVTYRGIDAEKGLHVIRIVDGDGKTAEYTYCNDDIEFTEDGIVPGTRVEMQFTFNDATCRLNVHLSKYKG